MHEQVKHKRKLTIADSELRDLFACFITMGLAMAKKAESTDKEITQNEWDEIAEEAYQGAAACIDRRKVNKHKLREQFGGDEDTRGNSI